MGFCKQNLSPVLWLSKEASTRYSLFFVQLFIINQHYTLTMLRTQSLLRSGVRSVLCTRYPNYSRSYHPFYTQIISSLRRHLIGERLVYDKQRYHVP